MVTSIEWLYRILQFHEKLQDLATETGWLGGAINLVSRSKFRQEGN